MTMTTDTDTTRRHPIDDDDTDLGTDHARWRELMRLHRPTTPAEHEELYAISGRMAERRRVRLSRNRSAGDAARERYHAATAHETDPHGPHETGHRGTVPTVALIVPVPIADHVAQALLDRAEKLATRGTEADRAGQHERAARLLAQATALVLLASALPTSTPDR